MELRASYGAIYRLTFVWTFLVAQNMIGAYCQNLVITPSSSDLQASQCQQDQNLVAIKHTSALKSHLKSKK
jgi:hypothetical protein